MITTNPSSGGKPGDSVRLRKPDKHEHNSLKHVDSPAEAGQAIRPLNRAKRVHEHQIKLLIVNKIKLHTYEKKFINHD